MLNLLKRMLRFFRRQPPKKIKPLGASKKRREKEHYGSHYYLGDLLDSLDDCFNVYPLFRKADPDGYALFRRLGAQVSSSDGRIVIDALDPYLTEKEIPSFACVHYRDPGDNPECLTACFISVRKQNRPVNVELSNHDVYDVTMVYRDPKKPNVHQVGNFYVSVDRDSNVRVLRYQEPVIRPLGKKGESIVRMEWRRPTWLNNIGIGDEDKRTCEDKARGIFIATVNGFYAGSESGVTVRVYKGRDVAVFSIDMARTPYFFADRDKTVNENGRTKRILHIVRTHRRANGRYVKSHFRGLREFEWNGYRIKISVPNMHRHMLSGFGVKTVNERDIAPGEQVLDAEQMGEFFEDKMEIAS